MTKVNEADVINVIAGEDMENVFDPVTAASVLCKYNSEGNAVVADSGTTIYDLIGSISTTPAPNEAGIVFKGEQLGLERSGLLMVLCDANIDVGKPVKVKSNGLIEEADVPTNISEMIKVIGVTREKTTLGVGDEKTFVVIELLR